MKQYFGRFNYQINLFDPPEIKESEHGVCLLDGKEIKQVWYADTEAGIVKTYDVLGDGVPHAVRRGYVAAHEVSDFPGREIDAPLDGVLSETLHGKVEIFGPQ